MTKTNVMRLLDAAKIPYRAAEYEVDENDLNGMHAAEGIGMPPEQIFKTLVAKGERGGYAVFCIPVCCELDLKKKRPRRPTTRKIELIHVKDLLATTGYIRGGCSPIGMKKPFPTYIDETAQLYNEIGVSAGCRGCRAARPHAPRGLCKRHPVRPDRMTKGERHEALLPQKPLICCAVPCVQPSGGRFVCVHVLFAWHVCRQRHGGRPLARVENRACDAVLPLH